MADLSASPALSTLAAREWDLLVIGGGIVGAGIVREAARLGLRAWLVEQGDFASGTSSRSAKLVHGGFRYLARLQFGMVREAVRERERLLYAAPGLVDRLGFLLPTRAGDRLPPNLIRLALSAYDSFAGEYHLRPRLNADAVGRVAPAFSSALVTGAFTFTDAQTDDARLVLRVLLEGCRLGGQASNYTRVTGLLRTESGAVIGARLCDRLSGSSAEVRARAVVNATGPWADTLRRQLGRPCRLRLVRGSHLVFPGARLPVAQAIACRHPLSGRAVYFVPWQGVTLVGTTDEFHGESLDLAPRISPAEALYLLRAAQVLFPRLRLERRDIQATFAGVRPIADARSHSAASASREVAIWEEDGLLTVTGGKLTTFQATALRALKRLRGRLPGLERCDGSAPLLEPLPALPADLRLPQTEAQRLLARYGPEGLLDIAAGPRQANGRGIVWEELRWNARMEAVRHLDDLLLRRQRLGLTLPEGGRAWLESIRAAVQPELGWDNARWQSEAEAYLEGWRWAHGVPELDDPRNPANDHALASNALQPAGRR